MTQVMKGIRVLEVTQFMFVPTARELDPKRTTLMEHPNRSNRSIGLDFSNPPGVDLLDEIASTSDLFLTNYLPSQRNR